MSSNFLKGAVPHITEENAMQETQTEGSHSRPAAWKRNFNREGMNLVPVLDKLKRFKVLGRGSPLGRDGQTPGFLYETEIDESGRILAGKRVAESELEGHIHFITVESEEEISQDYMSLTSLVVISPDGIRLYRRRNIH